MPPCIQYIRIITKKNAISGGEIYNLKHNHNGLLCEDMSDLESKLLLMCTDKVFAKSLGANAYNYYHQYCTMTNMAQGFIDSIEDIHLAKIDRNI